MDRAGDDPVEQLIAGFRQYATIVDENRDAVVLTYRESRTLDAAGRERIKELEVETSEPMRAAVTAGTAAGLIVDVDADLVVFDLMMLAHGWALKHWHFAPGTTWTGTCRPSFGSPCSPSSSRTPYRRISPGSEVAPARAGR